MKITIVLGAFFPVPPIRGGAVEKAWFALAAEFAKRGHEVTMVSRTMPQFALQESLDGVQHLRVRGFDTPASLTWLKLLDLIYSIRAISVLPPGDIVVTNTFWLPILLGRSAGKVYVHVARYPKGQMRFYSRAARLHAPSNAIANAIGRESPRMQSKVKVVPYPAPQSTTTPTSIVQRNKVILYVGRVHPEKGVHILLETFAQLPREISSDWTLVIVGSADENLGGGGESYLGELKRIAGRGTGKVDFRGPIFDTVALEREFLGARLFVYPSLAEYGESFGLAPLEAMAHGCAVMVSKLECFSDFISGNETGFVFDHRASDPALALRDALAAAIGDENRLAGVAGNGHQKAAEYSIDRVADQFLHDFSSLLT